MTKSIRKQLTCLGVCVCCGRESENCEAGSPRVVRQQLLEFLSPVALHHGTSFLAAMAVVWRERKPTTLQTNYAVSMIKKFVIT